MDLKKLDINQVLLPDWNVKRKKEIEMFRIRASIQKLGQNEPIKVRNTGQKDMLDNVLYEIIDGRTVYSAMLDAGLTEIYCLDYGQITVQDAQTMYLQTEFTNKATDHLKLAELIHELSKTEPTTTLQNKLPFDKDQIEYYIELCEFDWREHLRTNDKNQGSLF